VRAGTREREVERAREIKELKQTDIRIYDGKHEDLNPVKTEPLKHVTPLTKDSE
jgi:hypothetical protein